MKNLSEKQKLELVKKDGFNIKRIINPSKEIQLLAVKKNVDSIKYIDYPFECVQLKAVRKDFYTIKKIKNPTFNVQLYIFNRIIHRTIKSGWYNEKSKSFLYKPIVIFKTLIPNVSQDILDLNDKLEFNLLLKETFKNEYFLSK